MFKSDYILEYQYPNRRQKHNFTGTKFCPRCKEDKFVEEFTTDTTKEGKKILHGYCRICAKAIIVLRRLNLGLSVKSTSLFCVFKGHKHCTMHENQEEAIMPIDKFTKRWDFYKCQSGVCLECNRKWHKDWKNGWTEEEYKKYLEKERIKNTKLRKENPERSRAYTRKSRAKHKDKHNAKARERMKTDPKYRIDRLMKGGISQDLKRRGLKKSGRKWLTMIPYNKEELLNHLFFAIKPDMRQEDFFNGKLHVGHFPWPRELFRYSSADDIEFQICWGLDNLKLQWGGENMSLMDKLPDGRFARNLTEKERMAIVQPLIDAYLIKQERAEILLACRAY